MRASLADQHDREQLRRMHSSRPDFGPSAYEEGGGSGNRRPSRDVGAGVGGSGNHSGRFWWGRSRGGQGSDIGGSRGISRVFSMRIMFLPFPLILVYALPKNTSREGLKKCGGI